MTEGRNEGMTERRKGVTLYAPAILWRGHNKNVGRARNWPLWAGDLYTEVTVKAGLTVISRAVLTC